MEASSNSFRSLASVAVVAFGLSLAAPGIGDLPFNQGDDATYYETARSLEILFNWGWQNPDLRAAGQVASLQERYDRAGQDFVLPYYSKPVFDVLYWLSFKVWGTTQQAVYYTNLLFFALAIWLVQRIGRILWGPEAGLLAALFFASSGSVLVYVRSGMANIPSMAFFLAGAYVLARLVWDGRGDRPAALSIPGFIWGISLATHSNLLPYIGLCGLALCARSWRQAGWRTAIQRGAFLAAGALAVALLVEAAYWLFNHYYGGVVAAIDAPHSEPYRSYFGQLGLYVDEVLTGNIALEHKFYTYVLLFWAHEGAVVCILVGLASLVGLMGSRGDRLLLALVLFWVPLLFFIMSDNQAVYRYGLGIVLPAVFLAAAGLERVLQFVGPRVALSPRIVAAAAIVALAGVKIAHLTPIYGVDSAWSNSADWLRQHGQGQVVTTAGRTLWRANGIEKISPEDDLGDGRRYLAVYQRYAQQSEKELIERRASGIRPVYSAWHRRQDKLLEMEFLEDNIWFDGLELIPVLGDRIAALRAKALAMNKLHVLELYELDGRDGGSAKGSGKDRSADPAEERKFG